MDITDLLAELEALIEAEGSAKNWANRHGYSEQHVSDVRNRRRTPGRRFLEVMGYEKRIRYDPLEEACR